MSAQKKPIGRPLKGKVCRVPINARVNPETLEIFKEADGSNGEAIDRGAQLLKQEELGEK